MCQRTARMCFGTLAALIVTSSTALVVTPRRLASGPSLSSKSFELKGRSQVQHAPLKSAHSQVKMALDIPATVIKVGAVVGAAFGVATVLRRRGGGRASTEAEDLRRYNEIMGKIGAKAPSSSVTTAPRSSPSPSPKKAPTSSPRPPAERPSEPRPTPSPSTSESDLLGDDEPTVVAEATPAPKAPSPPPKPPAPAPAPAPAPKKLGMGFFKRGPGRPTDLDTVLADATYDREFASQVVSSLAGAVKDGRFDSYKVSFEVEGGSEAEALAALMASRGISASAAAETLAGAVNAMLISLVDSAANAASDGGARGGDEAAMEAVSSLQEFMSHAGNLFEALATGVSITPVKYSGKSSKAKLEGLFTKYMTNAQLPDSGIDGDSVDNLMRVLGIKESKADQIGQKVMMESYAEMMQQEGGAEGMGALSEMMGGAPNAPMGGGGMGGGPPGALPEQEMQTMIDVLKEALQAPAEDRAEVVRELDKSFGNMGTSLDQLIEVMAPLPDPKAKELVGLFKQLKNPNAKPKPSKPAEDDLLGI